MRCQSDTNYESQVLANCAGFAIARVMEETSVEEMERILRVNTLGTAFVTRAVLPDMKAAGSGRVLFTSSVVGQVSRPRTSMTYIFLMMLETLRFESWHPTQA